MLLYTEHFNVYLYNTIVIRTVYNFNFPLLLSAITEGGNDATLTLNVSLCVCEQNKSKVMKNFDDIFLVEADVLGKDEMSNCRVPYVARPPTDRRSRLY